MESPSGGLVAHWQRLDRLTRKGPSSVEANLIEAREHVTALAAHVSPGSQGAQRATDLTAQLEIWLGGQFDMRASPNLKHQRKMTLVSMAYDLYVEAGGPAPRRKANG